MRLQILFSLVYIAGINVNTLETGFTPHWLVFFNYINYNQPDKSVEISPIGYPIVFSIYKLHLLYTGFFAFTS